MRTPMRLIALLLAVLAFLYCALLMATTWSEAGFVNPLIVGCFIAVSIIIGVIVWPRRH